MKRSVFIWQFAGLTFVSVLGTILHFLYDWTGMVAVAPFSAVNESTWEHMKLFFVPAFLFALLQSFFFKEEYGNYWCIKTIGIAVGLLFIPVLFYTSNGVFGKTPDWWNILSFFLSSGIAYLIEWILFKKRFEKGNETICLIILFALALCFIVFTFFPPKIPLFQDPITGRYGLNA